MSETREGVLEWNGHRTWYRVDGDLESGRPPVVLAHGGPGATHDYMEPIAELSRSGRACILYDQLGNGRSDHVPAAPPEFWTVQLFKDELDALVRGLGIADSYHFLGQSWGGMLGMEHALDHPPGLRGLVVANSPASMRLWVEEANRLRELLPPDVQATLERHEADGTTDSPEYEAAVDVFYRRHLCRTDPWPDCLVRSFAAIADNPTVYTTMNGPSEFHVVGSLLDWNITERLHEIAAPTLLVSGEYDEATPRIVEEIHVRIPDNRWEMFENGSHSTHLEQPERFLALVESFLDEVDARV
jgi:L-proline amide hydrolase